MNAMRGLTNVLIFLTGVFIIFSILGLQWFSGAMHYQCRVGHLELNQTEWSTTDFGICTPHFNQYWSSSITTYAKCPADFDTDLTCASEFGYGLEYEFDSYNHDESL